MNELFRRRYILFSLLVVGLASLAHGQAPSILYGPHSEVTSIQYSPGGQYFYTASPNRELVAWDGKELKPAKSVPQASQSGTSVAGRNDAANAYSGADTHARVFDMGNGEMAASEKQPNRVNAVGLSPDESMLAIGGGRFASRGFGAILSPQDASTRVELKGHKHTVCAVGWSPNGNLVATGGGRFAKPGEVRVYDPTTGDLVVEFSTTDAIESLAFAPNNRHLAAGGRDKFVHIFDVRDKKLIGKYELISGGVLAVAFNADGTLLRAVNRQGMIRTWNVQTQQVVSSFNAPDSIAAAAFSPDATQLVTSSGSLLHVWQLTSFDLLAPSNQLTANIRRTRAGVECNAPNIIVIMADDLGHGDLGAYGQQQILTPNIDRLAYDGIRFTNYYAGTSTGTASRCSFWTGLHTGHTRLRGNKEIPLDPADVTIAEILAASGYATGIFGEWRLGDVGTTGSPNRQGFRLALGSTQRTDAEQYFPASMWLNESRYPVPENAGGARKKYGPELLTQAAMHFMEENRNQAFLLHISYTIPRANTQRAEQLGDGQSVPSPEPYANKQWPEVQKNYAAMITRMDSYVGQIRRKVEELRLGQDTVIFVTSDNGPHAQGDFDPQFFKSAGDLRGGKGSLFEGGLKVPMIVHWPRKIRAGRISGEHFGHFDFMATALGIAATDVRPRESDGVSMLNLMKGGVPDPREHRVLYFENHDNGFQQALRNGRWKVIRQGLDGPIQLYDLRNDPAESENVAYQHEDVVEQAKALLKDIRTPSSDWPVVGE